MLRRKSNLQGTSIRTASDAGLHRAKCVRLPKSRVLGKPVSFRGRRQCAAAMPSALRDLISLEASDRAQRQDRGYVVLSAAQEDGPEESLAASGPGGVPED